MNPPPVIEFEGVSRVYPGPPAVHALRPADLVVRQGDYVAVIGPSGSGKTTFLHLAGLLDSPSTGRYRLDGVDVTSLPESRRCALRAKRIGFVFQAFHLLPHRTALENVVLALLYSGVPGKQRTVLAARALESVHLGHRRDATPTTLSGGEQQRVAVARALVNRPSLLLCDEPTGNLDTATAEAVLRVLGDLHAAGMTLLVVTHNDDVAARADRVVRIRDGWLEERR